MSEHKLPQTGGSYTRSAKGALKQVQAPTGPARKPTAAEPLADPAPEQKEA